MSILDALAFPFFQRALVAGLAIAVMAGLLGVFVVQRRLSFLGDGLAHAAFGGMGIGAFVIVSSGLVGSRLGLFTQPLWFALPFSMVAALVIAWLRRGTRLRDRKSVV